MGRFRMHYKPLIKHDFIITSQGSKSEPEQGDICPHCKIDLFKDCMCNIIGIEIPTIYDGVGIWQCTHCLSLWNRFPAKHKITMKFIDCYQSSHNIIVLNRRKQNVKL